MHLGRVVNSNDLLLEQVNEVERESNIFGGCSPMQSGRVLYQKNMRVTAKQSWYNRTEQIRKAKRQNEIKTRLKWKQTVIYQGDHIPFLCVRNSRIFTAALGKELYYVRNYWIYRAS